MNIICVAGQLGSDAELKYLPDGTAVSNFSVADNQGRDKPTIWWRCQLFGKRAESLAQYLTKGQPVTVSGTMSQREYTDRDGAKKTAQELRVNDVALQGGQRQQESTIPAQRPPSEREQNRNRQYAQSRPQQQFDDDDLDSVPF